MESRKCSIERQLWRWKHHSSLAVLYQRQMDCLQMKNSKSEARAVSVLTEKLKQNLKLDAVAQQVQEVPKLVIVVF